MKLTSSVKFLLALVVAATAATASYATNVKSYSNGDFLLGFYDQTGASTNDYVIDIGPVITGTTAATDHSFVLTLSNLNADLTTAFGSNWYTSGNIVYSLISSQPAAKTVFLTNPNLGTPWLNSNSNSTAANQTANAGALYSQKPQTNGETQPNGLIQVEGTPSTTNFTYGSEASQGFQNFNGNGGDGYISDIPSNPLELDFTQNKATGSGIIAGTFTLSNAGVLTYNSAVVPEPSTFAAIGLGAAVLAFARRRRNS